MVAARQRSMLVLALFLPMLLAACGSRTESLQAPAPPPAPLSASAYSHYLRGRVASFEGDQPLAIREFRAATAAAPDQAPILVAFVDALLAADRLTDARRSIEAAQMRWPHEPEIWLASGRIYRALAAHRTAARAFERAIRYAPDDARGYLLLTKARVALSEPAAAEAVLRELIEARPELIEAYFELGQLLASQADYARAEPPLRNVLELDPDHLDAAILLVRSLVEQQRASEAAQLSQQLFDRSGGDPWVAEQLFRQLLDAGAPAEALALLRLLDRNDLPQHARVAIAHLYLQLGQLDAAEALASDMLAVNDRAVAAQLLRAQVLAQQNRYLEALPLLLGVTTDDSVYARSHALAADLASRMGRFAQARQLAEAALAHRRGNRELLIALAQVHERAGDARAARQVLAQALDAHPADLDLLYAAGTLEDRLGAPRRAVAFLERILALEPDHVSALNFLGYSLADRGVELARAERLLSRALELAPLSGYVLDSYGWLLVRLQRYREAEAMLLRAARLSPREPEILWHLGELYLTRGERERGLELLERARAEDPSPPVRQRIEARIHAVGGES